MAPTSPEATRARAVQEALSWIGTPFHDCARVKGAGVDCANLLIAVYAGAGLVELFEPEHYSPQWFLHRDEPRFLDVLARHGRRIDPAAALPGDVLMYRFGRHAAHGAIVLNEMSIVHAYKPAGCVCRTARGELLERLDSAWSLFA